MINRIKLSRDDEISKVKEFLKKVFLDKTTKE